jgi:hypothetical protein
MLHKNISNKSSTYKKLASLLVVIIVASLGTYLLIGSHAATPYASITADSGNVTASASKQACSGSTDGSCVIFGSTSSGGGTSNKGVPFIGLNDFIGWGPPLTHQYLSDGFRWGRVEVDGNYSANNAIDAMLSPGCDDGMSADSSLQCNADVIIPDNESEAMTWINHYNTTADASRIIWEFGNEQYLTNSGYGMSAQAYAQAYEATYTAKHAVNAPQPLLFMTTGDPCWGTLVEDACTNGAELYLEKAMDASKGGVANLKVDGFATHTYGGTDANTSNDTNGVDALLAQHQDAVNHGFTDTPWYVTEWGVSINPAQADGVALNQTDGYYAGSYAMQATDITSAYTKMVSYGDGTNGTWLKGIMYYQTHDDSTGWWGLLTSPTPESTDNAGEPAGTDSSGANTPIVLRPSYNALKAFLTNH